jgi:hypothetical protein
MARLRKRWWGALGGAGGALLVGAVAAAALAGGDGGTKEPVGSGKRPVGAEAADEPGGGPPESEGEAEPEPPADPLCVAQEARRAAIAPIGDVDGPEELEASILAQVTFYTTAAEAEPEPDAAAFRSMAAYYGAVRDFFAARGWRPDAGATDPRSVPQPPTDGSLGRTSEILVARCDLEVPTDTPAAAG